MALEDIFGSGSQFKGLLSDDDIGAAKNDALLNASLALLAAGGPSTQKIGIGQALAQAYGTGRKAFQGGIDQGLQTQDLRAKREQAMQEAEQRKQLQSLFANASTPEAKMQAYGAARDLAAARGDGKLASYYDDIIKRMSSPESNGIANVNPNDFTPESLRTFAQTRDFGSLVPKADSKFSGDFANIAQAMFGIADPAKLSPEQRAQVMKAADGYRRAGASSVALNTSDPTAVAKFSIDLQDKTRAAFKGDEVIANQYKAMKQAVQNPSAQGDTALLYSFFKVLDPESTVREGELDLVMSSRSIPDKVKGYAQKLATGETLTPKERQDLLNQATRQVQARKTRAERERMGYIRSGSTLGVDPSIIPNPYDGISFDTPAGNQPKTSGGRQLGGGWTAIKE